MLVVFSGRGYGMSSDTRVHVHRRVSGGYLHFSGGEIISYKANDQHLNLEVWEINFHLRRQFGHLPSFLVFSPFR
jgi:hypothetical protein